MGLDCRAKVRVKMRARKLMKWLATRRTVAKALTIHQATRH